MRMRQILLLLFIPLFTLLSNNAHANGYCYGQSGPNTLNVQGGNFVISNPENNVIGFVKNDAYKWSGFKPTYKCDCPASNLTYVFSSEMLIPPRGDGWYRLNDYLDMQAYISEATWEGGKAVIPFIDKPTIGANCLNTYKARGGTGTAGGFSLRIAKPFIGESFFPTIAFANIYSCTASDGHCTPGGGSPFIIYYVSGTVTVPQNCTINAGTQLTVDMGQFFSGDFSTVGQKPEHYTPKRFSVPIQCNDSSAQANLTLRIQGTTAANIPDALQSDNTDVGVIITDSNGNTLTPNNASSLVPFHLDDSNRANVTLQAYPVGTTANTPVLGLFTTLAYLRIDFS